MVAWGYPRRHDDKPMMCCKFCWQYNGDDPFEFCRFCGAKQ